MSRRRKSSDSTPFDTLRLEGSLFVPELLERAARGEATAQKESDYAVPKGLKLHDEYGRAFRIASALWQDFAAKIPRADLNAATTTTAFVLDLLRDSLGYADLTPLGSPVPIGDRGFPITAQALGGRLPVIIAPHTLGLDDPDPRFAIHGSGSRKKSAYQLAQEYLNASRDCLWALVTNGRTLRLLRDAESLTRPNFLEFDLETILRESADRYADFSALWRLLHVSRAGQPHAPPADCLWEKWKSEGHAQGLRVRDGLRDGVTQAILILGNGFLTHPDNTALRQRLQDGTLTLDAWFQQFFRLIYRCLFLFCTEERDLLHPADTTPAARQAYATGYSLRRLRSRSLRHAAHDPHGDLWLSLRIIFRGLATGEARLALPALGGLFAETQCPDLDSASLSNRCLLSAMRELRWFFDRKTGKRSAIDYRNMGTQELGSVYESLLELVPTLNLPSRTFGFAGITDTGSTSGNARKTTGSYYTPDSLVMELINSALEPVIRQRLAEARDLAALSWSTVSTRIKDDPVQRFYVLAYLVKHAAAPADASPEALGRAWDAIPAATRANPLCAEALLSITVCDPSCGSGHFLLAAARRLAEKLAELRAPDGAVRPDDYRHALREVASRCLYGVDINPMAVELCRVALWLETVDPGKPLGFLNHHIRTGNSLLGTTPDLIAAGLPDDTFTAIEGDDKPACAELKKRNKKEREGFGPLFEQEEQSIRDRLRLAATQIEAMDDSQPAALQQKEAAFTTSETAPEYRHAKLLADLWCAAFVIKKIYPAAEGEAESAPSFISDLPSPVEGHLLHTDDDLFGQSTPAPAPTKKGKPPTTKNQEQGTASGITTAHLRDFVQGKPLLTDLQTEVEDLASQYRFFHWHLAFPQVFAQGGFDCILGNPPWERVKLAEKEWFAERQPEIAKASNAAIRKKLIKKLRAEIPALDAEFREASRHAEGESQFMRNSGFYVLCARGDINLYAVFAEVNRILLNRTGRVGCVLPTGIATDDTTKHFFQNVVSTQSLISLFDFENKDIFPSVDSRYKFCLLTVGSGKIAISAAAEFVFFAHSVDDLFEGNTRFELSPEDILLLNPNTKTCPIFRSTSDAELTKLVYRRLPVLLRDDQSEENMWAITFSEMFHMTNDANLFHLERDFSELKSTSDFRYCKNGEDYFPLIEGKMIDYFDHRQASVVINPENPFRTGGSRASSDQEKLDPLFTARPRYWVNSAEVESRIPSTYRRQWLLGFQKVTSPTNERTFLSSLVCRSAVGASFPVIFCERPQGSDVAVLYANLAALVFDYVVRQKVGGINIAFFVVRQLPVLRPEMCAQPCAWANDPKSEIPNPPSLRDWLLPRVLELTYTAWDLKAFAADCGWSGPPFRWDEERRFLLRCELDAAFFHLYLGPQTEWQQQPEALTRAFPTPRHAVSYIMDTFPIVKRKDEAKHGHYRTKETILQIYDALGEAMQAGVPYQTLLNPPPADAACCHPPKS